MIKRSVLGWHLLNAGRIRQLLGPLLCLFLAVVLIVTQLSANAVTATEGRLRAAVIVGIMRFTTWPDTPEFKQAADINLCLIGAPTSAEFLLPISGQRRLQGKNITVRDVARAELDACQVLVIGGGISRHATRAVLAQADKAAILSICDDCRAELAAEPIINLTLRKKKVKFRVNLARAKQSGVGLDAQLLELALSVRKE